MDTKGFDHLPTQRVPPLVLFKKSIFGRPTLKFFYLILYFVQSKAGDNALVTKQELSRFPSQFNLLFLITIMSDAQTGHQTFLHQQHAGTIRRPPQWSSCGQTTKFDFDHNQKSGASLLSSRVYLLK